MTGERFVVVGLAQVRSPWFRDVARWATSQSLPLEFLKAMSVEEVRVRLRSGRSFSALLIDDSLHGIDRDLVDLATAGGCAVVLVDSGRGTRLAGELGAAGVLPSTFDRDALLQLLDEVAAPIRRAGDGAASAPPHASPTVAEYRGRLVAVTGSPGAGRSTLAMAISQGLAADPRHAGLVCLADLALDADQALLHDAGDVVPGVLELAESHRSGTPTVDQVRNLTWWVDARGYHLLLGLRRHRDWTSLRPRALTAALDGLRRSFRLVVADVDADLEGERTTGSLDVEERNAMARATVGAADLVVVVGSPGMVGLHALLRTTRAVLDHGVPGDRILPVVNRAPKSPRARAELARAFGELLVADVGHLGLPTPIHLGERRNLEQLLRDGGRLPDGWLAPICGPVQALLDAGTVVTPTAPEPVRVAPGSLGSWTDDELAADELDGGEAAAL
jgi:hypothetical protein